MQRKQGFRFYLQLFRSTFMLSAFTFGGGYVIVPLMRKRFVEEYHWIEEEEMLDLVAISQSAPGPIAINASLLIGYRLAGVPGSLITTFGTVLPPLIVISAISMFYNAFKESAAVATVLKAMSAGVAAVVLDAIIKMVRNIVKEKSAFSLAVMVLAFAAVFFFRLDVKLLVAVCALAGIGYALYNQFIGKKRSAE